MTKFAHLKTGHKSVKKKNNKKCKKQTTKNGTKSTTPFDFIYSSLPVWPVFNKKKHGALKNIYPKQNVQLTAGSLKHQVVTT